MLKDLMNRLHDRNFLAAIVITLCLVISAPAAFSQSGTTGALAGTTTDSSGAALPNVTVTATSNDTNQVRTTNSGADGSYKFGLLNPGTYKLKFEAAGFGTVEVPAVTVIVTETAVFNQILQVGAQAQQIEVTANAEAVQTASATVGTVIDDKVITEAPLTTRNYTNLLGLSAGANSSVFNAGNLGKGTTEISVNGATTSQNNYQQDGASIVAWSGNGFAGDSGGSPGIAVVNPDAIQEFKIQTSMFDAGYGRKPGAVVNVVTKSGTNQFHGTAFEFFRNTDLNANDFFRSQNTAPLPNGRPVLNQNQFGGSFGGPVKKDKLFFFASYQETRQINGLSAAGAATPTLVGIPTGDRSTAAFKTALAQAFCTAGTVGCAANGGSATVNAAGTAGGGGKSVNGPSVANSVKLASDGSNINQVALNILNLKLPNGQYMIPSSPTGLNFADYISDGARFTEHQAIGNVDYVINDKNTLSTRWTFSDAITSAPIGCNITSATLLTCLEGSGSQVTIPTQYAVVKLTSTLTNNLVNEARFSGQRSVGEPMNTTPFTNEQVGMASLEPQVQSLNGITITGLFQFGAQLKNATDKYNTAWEASDQLSWSHGKHTIRTGFEYEHDYQNWHFPGLAIGALTFASFQDFLIGLPGCSPVQLAGGTSCAVAGTNGSAQSNISKSGNSVGITPPGGEDFEFRGPSANAFVQDDFKANSHLTLNIGVRWEWFPLNTAANGENTNVWVPLIATVPNTQLGTTAATGTLAGFVVPANFNYALFPAPPVGGLYQNNQNGPTLNKAPLRNFAPRFGLAWKPFTSDKFVFRAGFGTFYDRAGNTIYNKSATQGSPYDVPVAQSGAANYYSSEASPYCTGPNAPNALTGCATPVLGWTPRFYNPVTGTGSNLAVLSTSTTYLVPVVYQWNGNIQYQFANSWVVQIGYVGSRGVHQVPDATLAGGIIEHNANQPLLTPGTAYTNYSAFCPTPTTNKVCAAFANPSASNATQRVPYLGFSPTGIGVDQTIFDSKFNSVQATLTHQFSHGLQFEATYTWARGFDTSSYIAFNDANMPVQYGLMPYLRPQRLTVNYSYQLPFGKHEGMLDKLTSGWVVSGVTIAQDGFPQTITDVNGGNIYGGAQTSTAQYCNTGIAGCTGPMGNANVATSGSDKSRLFGWYGAATNPTKGTCPQTTCTFASFAAAPTSNGYGNSGYGTVLGPGQWNWDISLVKTTKVGGFNENATLVFRSEFFNAFNHAQFNPPVSNDVTSSTFGVINTTSVSPRLIQFALKYVF